MTAKLRFGLILCVIIALVVKSTDGSMSRAPRNNDVSTVADALKYLEELEEYYGDKARYRFGKRASMAQILHNRIRDGPDMTHTAEFPPAEVPF